LSLALWRCRSAGKLVEPVAQESRFGWTEWKAVLVCGDEGGVEGEGAGGEAWVSGRGRVGDEGVDEDVAHPRGDFRIAVIGRDADQREGDVGDGCHGELGSAGGRDS
jgi:hypothetical protein